MRARALYAVLLAALALAFAGCADPANDPVDAVDDTDTSEGANRDQATSDDAAEEGTGAEPVQEQREQGEGQPDGSPEESGPAHGGNLTVHFVDVGQGDGIVVHHPQFTAVYDTGRWHGDSQTAVREHLQAEDADPDALVISHPDADHAGGCDVVLEAFAIEAIYHPGLSKDTQTWEDCEAAMQAEGAPTHTGTDLDIGQTLDWTETGAVELLHVDASASDANAGSIVLGLIHGDVELVLAGDMTCEVEEAILDGALVEEIDIVQVAHHGSSTSTCDPWLDVVRPDVGVISVGENNYGHPTDEVLGRLASYDVATYRTDHHGTVEVTTNGTTWDVRTDAGEGAYEQEASKGEDSEETDDGNETSADEISVTAGVSDPEPCQYTDVTVSITAEDGDGDPIEGADTVSTWNYRSSSPQEEGTTGPHGEDEHTRYISRATAGYEVVVDIDVEHGDAGGQAQTSFTPQEC